MNIRRRRKGVILLQTLVMSVVLSLMAVMVLKWVLGRYMLAARAYRSTKSFSHTEGYSAGLLSRWNFNASPAAMDYPGAISYDNQNVSYTNNVSGNTNVIVITSDEEDITN
jgi:hypothetical protein